MDFVIGFEDELDWSEIQSKVVMGHALEMMARS